MNAINHEYLSWAEINLSALKHNLTVVSGRLKPGTKIMAVIKANAYGHGAVEISRTLLAYGVDALAVATADEAAELRQNGIHAPILILGSIGPRDFPAIVENDLTASLSSYRLAAALNEFASRHGQIVKVHLRIDTGMGSYGVMPNDFLSLLKIVAQMDALELRGVYTHINAIYGGEMQQAAKQAELFRQLLQQSRDLHIDIPVIHMCSSPAIFKLPDCEYDMVRLGIVLYGLPCGNDHLDQHLQAVMQIKTRISMVKNVAGNYEVGYGSAYKTSAPACIATLPLGYADAVFLYFINQGEVLIRGQRAPIIGKVCMDHLIVDISHIPGAALGDEAVILGVQGDEIITAEEIAGRSNINQNNIDIVCLIGSRLPYIYV